MKSIEKQRGFTLIEMLVYLALFALIMSGTFAGAFQLIEHSNRTRVRVVQNEEIQFVFRKINWALQTAEGVQEPDPGESGDLLMVNGSYGTLRFEHEEGQILLNGQPLSSNRVVVHDFTVVRDGSIDVIVEIEGVGIATSTYYLYE